MWGCVSVCVMCMGLCLAMGVEGFLCMPGTPTPPAFPISSLGRSGQHLGCHTMCQPQPQGIPQSVLSASAPTPAQPLLGSP